MNINNIKIKACEFGYEKIPINGNSIENIVIMLHGLGASGQDLTSLTPIFDIYIPNCYYFFPNGISQYQNSFGCYQWFDFRIFEDKQMEIDSIKAGILSSSEKIVWLLKQQLHKVETMYNVSKNYKVHIAGFSQGSMVALHLACHNLIDVDKVLSFSGVFVDVESNTYKKDVGIYILHGEQDSVIPVDYAYYTNDKLKNLGFCNVQMKVFDSLAHSISYESASLGAKFLAK